MFAMRRVSCDDEETPRVEIQYIENTRSLADLTAPQFEQQDHPERAENEVFQGNVDISRSAAYVSLLPDIVQEDRSLECRVTDVIQDTAQSMDYTSAVFSSQDGIPLISDVPTSLQNDSGISCQTENLEYGLALDGQSDSQYFIIQPVATLSPPSGDNCGTVNDHVRSSSHSRICLDSSTELEDAVANITQHSKDIDSMSPEQSFIVSTNGQGEIKNIKVIKDHTNHKKSLMSCLPFKDKQRNLAKLSKRSEQCLLKRLKGSSFHLKKFSVEELDRSGSKTKQELFEEYLLKSASTGDQKRSIEENNVAGKTEAEVHTSGKTMCDSYTESKGSKNDDRTGVENLGHVERVNFSDAQNSSKITALNANNISLKDHKNNAEESGLEDNVHIDMDTELHNALNQSDEKESKTSSSTLTADKEISQNLILKKRKSNLEKPISKFTKLSGKKVNVSKECVRKEISKTKLSENFNKSEKPSLEDESEGCDEDTDSRLTEECCHWFTSPKAVVLHLRPFTLDLLGDKDKLIVEINVNSSLKVGAIEKGALSNGLINYRLNICKSDSVTTSSDFVQEDTDLTKLCDKVQSKEDNIKVQKARRKKVKQSRTVQKKIISDNNPSLVEENLNELEREMSHNDNDKESDSGMTEFDKVDVSSIIRLGEHCKIKDKLSSFNSFDDLTKMEDACEAPSESTNFPINISPSQTNTSSVVKTEMSTIRINSNPSKTNLNSILQSERCVEEAVLDSKPKKKYSKMKKNTRQDHSQLDTKKDDTISDRRSEDVPTPDSRYTEKTNDEGVRMYVCETCGYMSRYEQNTRKHVGQHFATWDWVCEVCGLHLKSKHYLRKHGLVHQRERPFRCPLCPQAFKSRRKYQCSLCGKETSNRQNMDIHMNGHSGQRPWQCEVCGLGFKGPSNLRAHKHQHEEELKFSCHVCGKKFRDCGTYRQHLKRHLGDKQHVCEHCGKSFVITSDLKKHIRTHTREKPFCCSVCGREFSDGSSHVRHEKTHAVKHTRFECAVCRRHYSRKDLCKKHIKKAHTDLQHVDVIQINVDNANKTAPQNIKFKIKESKVRKGTQMFPVAVQEVPFGDKTELKTFDPPKKCWQSFESLTEVAAERYREQSLQIPPGSSHYIDPALGVMDYCKVAYLTQNAGGENANG